MAIFKAKKGYRFFKFNKQYQILRDVENGWQIENVSSGMIEIVTRGQFYNDYLNGNISIETQYDYIPMTKTDNGWIETTFNSLDLNVQKSLKHKKLIIDQHIRKNGENLSLPLVELTLSENWN